MQKLRQIIFPVRLKVIAWIVKRIEQSAEHHSSQKINIILLVLAWGNLGYAGNYNYLLNISKRVKSAHGYILECRSGVTTVLIAAITSKYKIPLIVLEHNIEWLSYLETIINESGYNHVELLHVPLHDYGCFSWYNVEQLDLCKKTIQLVICDGPPGNIRGGRYGMLPILGDNLADDCIVLLDDTHRKVEKDIIKAWQKYRSLEVREIGFVTRHSEIMFL